jgi:chromosomal replication initiation ATPase DnaA
MYVPTITPSQRKFNALRDVAQSNISGSPMPFQAYAPERLAAMRQELAEATENLYAIRYEIEAKTKERDAIASELAVLKVKLGRFRSTLADYYDGDGPSINGIKRMVCSAYGLTLREISSSRRDNATVLPRQIAMYIARKLTKLSLPVIGRAFGGRDHSTVLHAATKIERLCKTDITLRGKIEAMIEQLECASNE